MTQQYIPPQKKVITSVALEQDIANWIEKNIPDGRRSDFINKLARRYIQRRQAVEARQAESEKVAA